MKIGELYNVYWPYDDGHIDEHGRTGKIRPALIVATDDGLAIAISLYITSKEKKKRYRDRIEIIHWDEAGLDRKSWVEIGRYMAISLDDKEVVYRGELHSSDFSKILFLFNRKLGR